MIGVVGAAISKVSIHLAALLAASNTPQISYSSTSTALSNKVFYPSFLRTIPPDNFQAYFIVDILRYFNWTYVNIIASDDDYGRMGIRELAEELRKYNICVGLMEVYDILRQKQRTERIISQLVAQKQTGVIIAWCQHYEMWSILDEAQTQKLYHR